MGTRDLVLWTAPLDRAKDTEMAIMCEILTGGASGAAHHTIAAKAPRTSMRHLLQAGLQEA